MTNLITRAMAKKAAKAVKELKDNYCQSEYGYVMSGYGAGFDHRIAKANRKFTVTFAKDENNNWIYDVFQIWERNYSICGVRDDKFMFTTDTNGITTVLVVDDIGNSKTYTFERGEI